MPGSQRFHYTLKNKQTEADSQNKLITGFRRTWECFTGDGEPCDIMEVLVYNEPHLAVTYPASHHITIINREKKMTIAYKKKSYIPTLLRKIPHYIEDVFTLDQNTVGGKCGIHVLDCCKLPWRRLRTITLETGVVNDFSIIDSSPCNVIVTTNTSENLIQGFSFVNGNVLWSIAGKSCNIQNPCKIAANNQDEIYITESGSCQVHLISASGFYHQTVVGTENSSRQIENLLFHRQELLAVFQESGSQNCNIYKISECRENVPICSL